MDPYQRLIDKIKERLAQQLTTRQALEELLAMVVKVQALENLMHADPIEISAMKTRILGLCMDVGLIE